MKKMCVLLLCSLGAAGFSQQLQSVPAVKANAAESALPSASRKDTFRVPAATMLPESIAFSLNKEYDNAPVLKSINFIPQMNWHKKTTLYVADGFSGGYSTYNVYDTYLVKGNHVNTYYEIAPADCSAYRIAQNNGGSVASLLVYGLLRDVLDINTRVKIGKRSSISFFED